MMDKGFKRITGEEIRFLAEDMSEEKKNRLSALIPSLSNDPEALVFASLLFSRLSAVAKNTGQREIPVDVVVGDIRGLERSYKKALNALVTRKLLRRVSKGYYEPIT